MFKNFIAKSDATIRKGLCSGRSRKASVRNQKALLDAINFEALETRQLMTALSVTDFGATTNGSGNDQSAVQSALNAAKPGDTVSFPAGTFNIDGSVTIPTGVTVVGDASGASHLKFNLGGQDLYGFKLAGNDSNVTIKDLDVVSTNGIIEMGDGSGYHNTLITDNRFEYGGGVTASGNLVYGISVTVANNATDVTYNYFHDSPHSIRNWCVFSSTNSHFDHNTFSNVFDGGQLQFIGANDTFNYNYATGLGNKLQEGDISGAANFQAIGNVAYGWSSTNLSSMGLSLLSNTQGTVAAGWPVEIENNYIDLSLAGHRAGGTSGVVMELGGGTLNVSNNILGSATAPSFITSDTANSVGTNNQAYGSNQWGYYTVEVGPSHTVGAWVSSTGSDNPNLSAIPAPPANTNWYLGSGGAAPVTSSSGSGGASGSASTGTTGSASTGTSSSTGSGNSNAGQTSLSGTANGITGLTATVGSNNSVKLAWTSSTTLASAAIKIVTTVGRTGYPTVVYQGDVNGATVLGLHAGWQYDFTVTGTSSTGTTVTSQVLTVRTTGSSSVASAASPTAGASTVNSTASTGSTSTGSTSTGSTSTGTTSTGTTSTGTTSTGTTSTGTTSTGTTSTGTSSSAAITGLTGTVLSDHSVKLAWTNPNVTLTSASIQIVTSIGRQTFPAVVVNGNISSATLDQLHAGWKYDFTIIGTTSDGATVSSGVTTIRTSGDSAPAYTLAPIAQPTITAIAPIADAAITGLTATVLSDTSVQLAWANQNVALSSATVNIITTVGRQSYQGIKVSGNASGVTITGLHAGWSFDFTVVGTTEDGATVSSGVLTATLTGLSSITTPVLTPLTLAFGQDAA